MPDRVRLKPVLGGAFSGLYTMYTIILCFCGVEILGDGDVGGKWWDGLSTSCTKTRHTLVARTYHINSK